MNGQHIQQRMSGPTMYGWLPTLLVVRCTVKMKFTMLSRSRLRIGPRETGAAVQCHASPLILHALAKSGAYSRDLPLFATASIFIVNHLRASTEFIVSRNYVPTADTGTQHAHFIPIVGVKKRGQGQHSFETTSRFTGPVPVDSRQ